ncbi:MAG: c-type cytochrome [Proteobacteria bacterium]|nr:c-type cytochrome [Pseudomonadota bacterium]MBK8960064.1 c-type cytochrome [Pseudomonadota bacterium]
MRHVLPALLLVSSMAVAADGPQLLKQQCAECHALTAPAQTDVERLWSRKGPDLHYAGDKFQRAWLVAWLEAPTRIRPGGEFYRHHLKDGAEGDVIDEASLAVHPKLDHESAEAVADALLALRVPGLVESGAYKGAAVSATIGSMFFGKLRGCAACHEDAPGKGGVSGPELHTASTRLNADYVYSYIKRPQAFDPHVWMPDAGLGESDLQRLTGYLMQLKSGAKP